MPLDGPLRFRDSIDSGIRATLIEDPAPAIFPLLIPGARLSLNRSRTRRTSMMNRPVRPLHRNLATLILLLPIAVTACGEANPLLGRWVFDADASEGLAAAGAAISMGFAGVEEIEFREDKMVLGGKSQSVSYEVADGRVIVTGADGEGLVYTIVDANHVVLDRPSGRVAYKRAQPPVAEPGAAEEQ
jgi:hypothetical protein